MSDGRKAFDAKIEELANFLCDRALGNKPVDGELIDTFKALSGYYASSRKVGQKAESEDKGGGFAAVKQRIASAGSPRTSQENAVEAQGLDEGTNDSNPVARDSDESGPGMATEPVPFSRARK